MRICFNCAEIISDGVKKCPNCGRSYSFINNFRYLPDKYSEIPQRMLTKDEIKKMDKTSRKSFNEHQYFKVYNPLIIIAFSSVLGIFFSWPCIILIGFAQKRFQKLLRKYLWIGFFVGFIAFSILINLICVM